MISTNEFKNGVHIDLDGTVYRIVEFQHVKPGKGGAFVRTKLKALSSGAVVDRTFRAGEKMPRVRTEVTNVTYLYNDGTDVVLMDAETFEQIHLPLATLQDELRFMKENDTVQLLLVDGSPTSLQLPAAVELAVTDTEPAVKGDTVSNVTKPATLETGAVVAVPLFVEPGERIRVDTRDARYISRA
ncbi:MAG TPA: elongation factor P [Gaiellales bacterium]|jgi:elongation factor P|nr:elongation factor P [Gaiellales bacterium]